MKNEENVKAVSSSRKKETEEEADVLDVGSNKYEVVLGSLLEHRSTPLLTKGKSFAVLLAFCVQYIHW